MPAVVRKVGNFWEVRSHAGRGSRRLGRFRSKRAAEAQKSAVNIPKQKRKR